MLYFYLLVIPSIALFIDLCMTVFFSIDLVNFHVSLPSILAGIIQGCYILGFKHISNVCLVSILNKYLLTYPDVFLFYFQDLSLILSSVLNNTKINIHIASYICGLSNFSITIKMVHYCK